MMNLDSLDPRIAAMLGNAGNPMIAQAGQAGQAAGPGGARVNMTPPPNSWSGDQFRVGAFPQQSAGAGPPTGVAPQPQPRVQPGAVSAGGGSNPFISSGPAMGTMMPMEGAEIRRRTITGGGNPFLTQRF